MLHTRSINVSPKGRRSAVTDAHRRVAVVLDGRGRRGTRHRPVRGRVASHPIEPVPAPAPEVEDGRRHGRSARACVLQPLVQHRRRAGVRVGVGQQIAGTSRQMLSGIAGLRGTVTGGRFGNGGGASVATGGWVIGVAVGVGAVTRGAVLGGAALVADVVGVGSGGRVVAAGTVVRGSGHPTCGGAARRPTARCRRPLRTRPAPTASEHATMTPTTGGEARRRRDGAVAAPDPVLTRGLPEAADQRAPVCRAGPGFGRGRVERERPLGRGALEVGVGAVDRGHSVGPCLLELGDRLLLDAAESLERLHRGLHRLRDAGRRGDRLRPARADDARGAPARSRGLEAHLPLADEPFQLGVGVGRRVAERLQLSRPRSVRSPAPRAGPPGARDVFETGAALDHERAQIGRHRLRSGRGLERALARGIARRLLARPVATPATARTPAPPRRRCR